MPRPTTPPPAPSSVPQRSLTVRVVILLLGIITGCVSVYGYFRAQLRRAEMLDEAQKEVRDHGTVLEVALDACLRDRDLRDLNEVVQDLSRADRVLGVLVFDARNNPIESSESVADLRPYFTDLAAQSFRTRRPVGVLRTLDALHVYAYAFPLGDHPQDTHRGTAVLLRDLSYIDANIESTTLSTVLLGLALALTVAAGSWFVLRGSVLRPVASLVTAVERVSAGSLDETVPESETDEVGRLARAFNHMVVSLRSARAELDAQNEASRTLERRLRHAQRLALVGQMAANVAHQVGSPLNVILGRARYAVQQGPRSERDARHFQEIINGAEQISRVIEQLLSQARKARGTDDAVDLAMLARDTLRFVELEAERVGVATSLHAPDSLSVRGSREEFEQVLLNLCVNALQAQPRGGRLEISLAEVTEPHGARSLELIVDDAGPGVPRELREQIFEPFFTTKGTTEGTGLGLSICDELVRRLGGSVRIDDSPLGGARFVVRVPRGHGV